MNPWVTWAILLIPSALIGLLCAYYIKGRLGPFVAAIIPWFGLLGFILYWNQYRGGIEMWQVVQFFGGAAASIAGLMSYFIFSEIFKKKLHHECGDRPMAQSTTNNLGLVALNGKSRIAAALFALFLGAFGGHKFYLGQVGLGILYLLFFWTAVPSIAALIEFILFLVMSDESFNEKYGQA